MLKNISISFRLFRRAVASLFAGLFFLESIYLSLAVSESCKLIVIIVAIKLGLD
jgi:hypothetical protein